MVNRILLIAILAILPQTQVTASQLNQAISQCAAESDSLKRLLCYDGIAKKHNLNKPKNYVKPDAGFLSSRLVAKPWEAEYSLSVADFVNLIASAVMEDGSRVKVKGWTRNEDRYVLNIVMESPVQLTFLPGEQSSENLSLLEPVKLKGRTTDASQFIMVIATMVP